MQDLGAFDALQTALLICRTDGTVVHANSALLTEVGASLRQMVGTHVLDWTDTPEALRTALDQIGTQRSSVYRFRAELRGPAQQRIGVLATASPGRYGVWFEMARLHEAGVHPNRMEAALHASTQVVRQLAHEIRNPLGGIRGAAQLLDAELGQPGQREYTEVILREVERLTALTDRMLVSHRQRPRFARINVHEVCQRVLQLVAAQYPRGLMLERDYDVSIPEVMADFEQLVQVVLNLVMNAAQALRERIARGDARICLCTRVLRQVTIEAQRHRLALALHVRDNGPGVPLELRERLFLPFVSSPERQEETGHTGHGLGLMIAQTLARQHHGLIRYEPLPQGSDFQLLLPFHPHGGDT